MKFKSIISLFAALVICVSSFQFAFAADGDSHIKSILSEAYKTNSFIACDLGGGELFTVTCDYGNEDDSYTLSVYNAETAELIKKKTLKSRKIPLECITECEIKDDGSFVLYDNYDGKSAVYNSDLTLKEKGTCSVTDFDYTELTKNNKFIGRFMYKEDGYARCSEKNCFTEPICAMTFYDDESSVYLTEDGNIESVFDNEGRKLLASVNSSSSDKICAAVYDYSANTYVSAETPSFTGYKDISMIEGELDGTYAFIVVESHNEYGYFTSSFIWKYSAEEEAKPFKSTKHNLKSIKKLNNDCIAAIKNDYAINIHIDKAPSTYPTYWDEETGKEYGGVIKGANVFDTYVLLRDLMGYLSYFPKGFTREMKCFGGKDHSFDIYIDKEIIGASAAYANRYDGFLICFATDEFCAEYIPHEFLHLIDARIDDYFTKNNKNYETEWDKLNPRNFFYYENQDYQPKFFVTLYAMSDAREDRADTFEYLFEAYDSNEHPFTQNAVRKKSIYLSQIIREVYPSVRKVPFASWEKWITPYPVKFKAKNTESSLKVYWSDCRTATVYELQQYKSGKWITVSKSDKKNYKLANLKSGKAYSFRVRAYRTDGKRKVYSSWEYLDTATKPLTPKTLKLSTTNKHTVKAKWSKVKSCSGYQLQYAKDKKFKKIIATKNISKKSKSYTGKNFTKGRKYYVRVRAYKESGKNKIYSAWSKTKAIKSK